MNRYAKALQSIGMEIVGETLLMGRPYQIARIKVGFSDLTIYFSQDGTARLDKPNRTKKWVYEKSPAQLLAVARQTLSFYNFGR